MDDKGLERLARDSIETFNNSDWERWRKLHAPNMSYEEIATSRKMTGHDEILTAYKGWRKAFPDMQGTVKNVVVGANQVVLEVEWKGTHRGTLETPMGVIPPSGRSSVNKATLFMKVERDRIILNRHYFDFYGLLRDVGALPETLKKTAGA